MHAYYVGNFQPPSQYLGESIARSRSGGLALFSCKRQQILQEIAQGGEISAERANPTRRASSLPCKHHLRYFKAKISDSQNVNSKNVFTSRNFVVLYFKNIFVERRFDVSTFVYTNKS